MLKRVRVRGFKCLHDVSVELGAFNVLIGKNDSGKSSFLQALSEPSRAMLRWHPTDPRLVSGGEWTVDLEGATGTLRFNSSHFNKPHFIANTPTGLVDEPLSFLSKRLAELWFNRHAEHASTDPISLDPGQVASDSPASNAALEAFVTSRGAGTAAHIASLALGDRERFDAIEASVQEVTEGRVRALVVKDIGSSTYTLSFKLIDGTVVAASQMSQGILLYVGFQALIQRSHGAGLLLVEEPERGLHPHRLVEVLSSLRALSFRGVQVLVTTHSPDVLSACTHDEIRIFHRRRPDSSTEVLMLPSEPDATDARESLGQIWSTRGTEGLVSLARSRPVLEAHGESAD